MTSDEPLDRVAAPALATPLEHTPALHDPEAVGVLPPDTGAIDYSAAGVRRERIRQLVRSPTFLIGAVILLWWIVCALFGRTFSPYNPTTGSLLQFNAHPSGAHWFGTDSLGRDVLSRVIVGSRGILVVATLATLLGTAVGASIGLVQGYFGGLVDNIIGRLVTLILVIGFVFSLLIGRTVRTAVLQERELDYVAAARLREESHGHIIFAEILPNVFAPILVEFTVRLGYAIFTVATLSFLGFGVQPPTPDWGADIAANYQYLAAGYWWETLFPALAIASLVVGVNLVADSVEAVVIQ